MVSYKKLEISQDELWPTINILNEVCHGISINDFNKEIGSNYNTIYKLLKKLSHLMPHEKTNEKKIIININEDEARLIESCFTKTFKLIDEMEFQTRIGISTKEAKEIKEKIKSIYTEIT